MTHWANQKTNLPASVRVRLLRLAKEEEIPFETILVRYASERLLYRLSCSRYAEDFVLKGAWLFYVWGIPRRTTRDVDVHGHGDNSVDHIESVICEVAQIEPTPPDGLEFDPGSARSLELQEDDEYSGVRVRITVYLGSAEIRAQVDVAFGEKLVDDPVEMDVPVLLDFPRPRLRTYSAEASIAEKLQAMVRFGSTNDRMKDYFDVYTLSREQSFEAARLEDQISATFSNRETPLPTSVPTGLKDKFGRERAGDWRAFLDDADAEQVPANFSEVVAAVRKFVHPPLQAIARGQPLGQRWHPDEGWMDVGP